MEDDMDQPRRTAALAALDAARDPLAEVLESIVASWDAGQVDNYGATDLILAVIRKSAARPADGEGLREALERIAGDLDDADRPAIKADRMRNIARAALAADKGSR